MISFSQTNFDFEGYFLLLKRGRVLEALSREINSGCPDEVLYADDLALVKESLDFERETGSLERSSGVKRVKNECCGQNND